MVPIWYMRASQSADSDTVSKQCDFEGLCQNPLVGVAGCAPWRPTKPRLLAHRRVQWRWRLRAGGVGGPRSLRGHRAVLVGRSLGLSSDDPLLDDPGHRFEPPGRTAAGPQRSVVEGSGYPAQGRTLAA